MQGAQVVKSNFKKINNNIHKCSYILVLWMERAVLMLTNTRVLKFHTLVVLFSFLNIRSFLTRGFKKKIPQKKQFHYI